MTKVSVARKRDAINEMEVQSEKKLSVEIKLTSKKLHNVIFRCGNLLRQLNW